MGLKNTQMNLVESFFIQHSLPRFPQMPTTAYGIFDSNINHRAQHFVCVSMRDQFEGQERGNSLIPIDKAANCNFVKLLWKYTRTVNVGFLVNKSMETAKSMAPFREIIRASVDTPVLAEDKLNSFIVQSTGTEETRLSLQIFAKAPEHPTDIYDDVTSLFSIHHADYSDREVLKTGNEKGISAMLMIAQSHSDPATLGINQKTLVDRPDFFATVHILNASSITLPAEDGQAEPHQSMYRDHSKWSVNVIYGLEGDFPPLLCFYDLNRSTKQATRGGGAFCLNSSMTGSSRASMGIWKMFMSFSPKPSDMARFNDANVNDILKQVLPKHEVHLRADPVDNSENSSSDYGDISAASSSSIKVDDREIVSSTRSRSSNRRRKSFLENPTLLPPSALFPSAELSAANYQTDSSATGNLLFIRNVALESVYKVPCPYKFKSIARDVIKNEQVPTKVALSIVNAVGRYDLSMINAAIAYKGLSIVKQSSGDVFSPALREHRFSQFNHDNTLTVNRKNSNRPLLGDLDTLISFSLDEFDGANGDQDSRTSKRSRSNTIETVDMFE